MEKCLKSVISIFLTLAMLLAFLPFNSNVFVDLSVKAKALASLEKDGNYFYYSVSNNEVTITGHDYYGSADVHPVYIPSSIGGYPVTTIGEGAFQYKGIKVQEIILPDSVETIEKNAFQYSSYITTVTFGNGIKFIGDSAFEGTQITALYLPESIERIGNRAFISCDKLKNISIQNNTASIGSYAFNGTNYYYNDENWENGLLYLDNYLLVAKTNLDGNISIKNGTTIIAENAFYLCNKIQSVTIPNTITTIAPQTFKDCNQLSEINLPDNLKEVSANAFENCTSLSNITIPEKVEYIGENAFAGCSTLSTINYLATDCSVSDDSGLSVFKNCNNVSKVIIGEKVQKIPAFAFTGCENLLYATIPDSVKDINDNAFMGCEKVSIVCSEGSYAYTYAVKNGLKVIVDDFEIKNQTLTGYTGDEKNLVLPSAVSIIGYGTFENNSNITNVEIPYSVTLISDNAFANCQNLSTIIIPHTVTSIGENAFNNSINTKIICFENSFAHEYAKSKDMPYDLISISLDTESLSLIKNQTKEIIATSNYDLSNNIAIDWKSNNSSVATVDNNGLVKAVSEGNAIISAYAPNGSLLADCDVVVTKNEYTITWNVDGSTTKQTLSQGTTIEKPTEPIKQGYNFVGWTPEIPMVMPSEDIVFIANFECIAKISINNNPNTKTINYGDMLKLTAKVENKPADATIKWYVDGIEKGSGDTFNISPSSGTVEITVKLVDKNNNPYTDINGNEISDSQRVKVNAGFFQKLISFFKNLFGANRVVIQAIKKF